MPTNNPQHRAPLTALGLGKIARFNAVLPLISNLGKEPRIDSDIIRALGMTKDPRAVAPLIARLEAGHYLAAEALGSFREARAVSALEAALSRSGPDERVRLFAARALAVVGTQDSLAALEAALQDPDRSVSDQAKHPIEAIRARLRTPSSRACFFS